MSIQLRQLDETTQDAFRELLREAWDQQTWCASLAKEIVEWRYFDRPPNTVTWLVMEDDRCVAMLDSMLRPYCLDGQRILVRETADWYCIPRLRSRGVGLMLMFQLRRYPESVFVLGGSLINVNILSKMRGWSLLPTAASFVMPIKARHLAANWARQRWWMRESLARIIPEFLPARLPRTVKPPPGQRAATRILRRGDALSLPLPDSGNLTQLLEQDHWTWITKAPPDFARPFGIEFSLDDVWVGFVLLQTEPTISGLDGRIVYVQATDHSLIAWMISESTKILADSGVGFIRSCVSTPAKIEAMRAAGYVKIRDITCHWWQRASPAPTSVDLGYLSSDYSMPFNTPPGRQVEQRELL